jgi:uncharacterized damage-inducible protein DinB
MSEIERIADQLRRAHEGEAWHGPALQEILKGVSAGAALVRPKPGAHNIWEILLHIGTWESVVRRRLSGEVLKNVTPEQDWPAVADASESAWQETQAEIRRGCQQLQETMGRLSDRQLMEPVPGMDYNVYVMLHGVLQHTLYHAGQIATLKRLNA